MPNYEAFARLEREGWTAKETVHGYVDLFAPASDMAVPELVAAVPAGGKVLDLCCGQGSATVALRAAGAAVTGLDFSPEMLACARSRAPDGDFVEGDAQDLPFADGAFDAVVSNFGLVHAPDQPRALAEVARVLRSGGVFAMTSWRGPDVSPAFQVFYGAVRAHGSPEVSLPEGPNFHQFADKATARALLANAGLTLAEARQVDCSWTLEDPNELYEIFRTGAPRGGYLLRSQPPDNARRIRDAMAETVRARFAADGRFVAPVPAFLLVASKG